MSFWHVDQPADRIACIDDRTYGDLHSQVEHCKRALLQGWRKRLALVLCHNSLESLVAYLRALQLHDAVILLHGTLAPQIVEKVVSKYAPDWIFAATGEWHFPFYSPTACDLNGFLFLRETQSERLIYSDLALLLSTSGSTGSPKLLRLSYESVAANAASIAEYLCLNHDERPITTLPMPIPSHRKKVGGSSLCTARRKQQPAFLMFPRAAGVENWFNRQSYRWRQDDRRSEFRRADLPGPQRHARICRERSRSQEAR